MRDHRDRDGAQQVVEDRRLPLKPRDQAITFEGYEVDRPCWLLRWQDETITINRKTFDLLLYLIDRRDRVVSKEELLNGVWPEQFVEESNLTQHIFLLRKAFSRHESGRRIIETVPGRGYRFTAAVEEAPQISEHAMLGMTESITRITIEEEVDEPVANSSLDLVSDPTSTKFKAKHPLVFGLLLACALVILISSGLFFYGRSGKHIHGQSANAVSATGPVRQAVAVLGFRNFSNRPEDAWLSTAVAEMLASEMGAGDKLRVIPTEDMARAQSDLGIKETAVDSSAQRASIRQATGADMLVQGSYVVVGQGATPALRLMVQVMDARSGRRLASITETGDLGGLFPLVDHAGADLRKELSRNDSRKDDSPKGDLLKEGEQALSGMSHDTDALRLYAEGLERERNFDAHSARSLFERAVEADPQFAMAHLGLADVWSDLGFTERAAKESSQAYKLAANLPRAERMAVEANYRIVSNDDESAINLYKALAAFYPDDETWGLKLGAEQFQDGREKDAVSTLERLRSLPLTPSEMVDLDGIEGAAYSHIDNPQANDKARMRLNEAVAIADKQGGMFIHGRAFRARCFALSHIGPVPAALAACEQAKATAQALGNLQAVAAATNNLGVLAQQTGDWKQSEADYEEGRRLYHQLGNLNYEAMSMQNLSEVALAHGDLARAVEESTQLSRVTGTSDDEKTAYEGHHFAAAALMDSGRLQAAEVEAMNAQRAADKEHPWDYKVYQQARSRDVLGWIAFKTGDLGEAKTLFHEALTMIAPTHDDVGEAVFTADEASVAVEQRQPDKAAIAGVRKAAATLSKSQEESDEAIEANVTLARLDLESGAVGDALEAIRKAKAEDSKGDSLETHFDVLMGEQELEQALGHASEARKILEDEVSTAKAKGYAYADMWGEIALAQLDAKASRGSQTASRLQVLSQQAEHAGFKELARQAAAH